MDWLPSQTRLFRALLHCYPAEFRHEYGSEMEQLFADRLRGEPRFRLWLETVADVVLSAPREHGSVLVSDVRYAIRTMAASPGFTAIALAVIAVALGATTAVFSLVNAVLLRSLPYGHPNQLVYLWSPNPRFQGTPPEMGPSIPDFYEWQRLSHSFSGMTMLRKSALNLINDGSTNRVETAFVTAGFFQTLEASPTLGRSIDANDDSPGNRHVAVISNRLWRSRFGSDPQVVGKQIQLNRERYTVIGVMPKEFGYPFDGDIPYTHSESRQTDIWLPAGYTVHQKTARADNFESADAAIGRLRNGVSASEAQGELAAIESHLDPLYPEMWRGWTALVRPLVQTIVSPVETTLWLLFGSVLVVLLIAISNMASLLLARATTRTHEMGIRTALGAERGRIIRQLLTESVLLSCMGGVLGIGLAYAAVPLLIHLSPAGIPRLETASVDGRVLLLAVLLLLATGILSGLAPITVASRVSVNDLLKGGGNRGAIGGSHRGRSALIVFEVALSVVLLAGAGLLIRSYLELERVNTGFSRAALTFRLTLDDRYNKPELRTTLYKRLLQKLQSIPGVTYAGASNAVPPLGNGETVTFVDIRGFGKSKEMVENRSVTRDYRKALGTPLLRGRDFRADDLTSKTPVVMVNQKFVDTYFKGNDPFRQQVRIGIGDMFSPWSTVVGVVGDVRHNKLEEAGQPQIFQPVDNGDNFAVKYSTTAAHVAEQARAALRFLDPALTLDNIRTMSERIDESNARRRFETTLLTGFGGIAIGLALIGLYGLMSYTVKERAAEIGIRVTLGSSRKQVVGLILRQGLRLTTAGLALGLGGAFALTRLVSGWVFGVKATDPMTFLAVPLFVLVITCFACLVPAWSAARIDPVETLRQQ